MFTVTNNITAQPIPGLSTPNPGVPYSQGLADIPALQSKSIPVEFVRITPENLLIITDGPSFINSGTGNDTITDSSTTSGDVVIDPGGGMNTIHASSNPANHDTIIVDAESDAPLTDVITGLKAGDNVLIKGLTALSPNDFTNATNGLMLAIHLPVATSPAANIVLSGYTTSDLAAGGRLSSTSFTPSSSMPEASSYLLLQVVR
jgi:hypothetical protein